MTSSWCLGKMKWMPWANEFLRDVSLRSISEGCPDSKVSWGQHGAHLGSVGPSWAPCWPHGPCYHGIFYWNSPLMCRLLLVWQVASEMYLCHLCELLSPSSRALYHHKNTVYRRIKCFNLALLNFGFSCIGVRCRLFNFEEYATVSMVILCWWRCH